MQNLCGLADIYLDKLDKFVDLDRVELDSKNVSVKNELLRFKTEFPHLFSGQSDLSKLSAPTRIEVIDKQTLEAINRQYEQVLKEEGKKPRHERNYGKLNELHSRRVALGFGKKR